MDDKDFLSNLNVNILTSAYTECWEGWKDINYTPEYNKFYLICNGEGWLKIGEKEYYPKPGELFIMPQGILQSYSSINNNPFKKYWCHFTAKIGDKNLFDLVDIPYYITANNFEELKALFARLSAEHENNTLSSKIKEKAMLLEILALYLEATNTENLKLSQTPSMDKLNEVLNFIKDHINENITVEQLAALAHFHPSYFTRIFKKYVGTSPIQYINNSKLEKSKHLLRTTSLPIHEIADSVGFSDIYYFSKAFKSYTGFSPTDYRRL